MVIYSHPKYVERMVKRFIEVYRAKGIIHANAFKRRYVPVAMLPDVERIAANVLKHIAPPPRVT